MNLNNETNAQFCPSEFIQAYSKEIDNYSQLNPNRDRKQIEREYFTIQRKVIIYGLGTSLN
jgi:hypothetical protein